VGPEAKLYKKLVKEWREFTFTRLENISLLGTPDLLVYNNNRHFFTIELKVTKGKKLKFSPHQIAFHVKHPDNTFIIAELVAWGLTPVIIFYLSLVLDAWRLWLVACRLKLVACGSNLCLHLKLV
jgi:hypothetical protein